MSADAAPLRVAHLASLHCGEPWYQEDLLRDAIAQINDAAVDLVVVAGDLTAAGYRWEYEHALGWLGQLEAPLVVVPGNHDSRNVGYIHFEELLGPRFSTYRAPFEPERVERLGSGGVTVIGLDSSQPDLEEGHVGREWYPWLREQFEDIGDDVRILVVHHHLVAVPGAGRELDVIIDAGDLLPILDQVGVDLVLTGHKRVPSFWGLNGMLLCNAGTVSSGRLRGRVPHSWNELVIDAATIEVFLHYPDGRRELSAVRSRASRRTVSESFLVSDDFLDSNHLPLG